MLALAAAFLLGLDDSAGRLAMPDSLAAAAAVAGMVLGVLVGVVVVADASAVATAPASAVLASSPWLALSACVLDLRSLARWRAGLRPGLVLVLLLAAGVGEAASPAGVGISWAPAAREG